MTPPSAKKKQAIFIGEAVSEKKEKIDLRIKDEKA